MKVLWKIFLTLWLLTGAAVLVTHPFTALGFAIRAIFAASSGTWCAVDVLRNPLRLVQPP